MGMFTSSKGDYDYTQDYSNFDSFIDKESVINGLHEVISDLRTELTQLKSEKSGEWVSAGNGITKRTICSNCQKEKNGLGYTKYCSECGAKMERGTS